MSGMVNDPYRSLKDAFGRFATGITVVACPNPSGGYAALTVNSFASVSLDPALVLWCIEKRASTFDIFMQSPSYAVSVLRADQRDVSERFARSGSAPMEDSEVEIWETGSPVLRERLAGFDCEVVDRHTSGDHVILIARTVKFDSKPGAPLLYFASNYRAGPTVE